MGLFGRFAISDCIHRIYTRRVGKAAKAACPRLQLFVSFTALHSANASPPLFLDISGPGLARIPLFLSPRQEGLERREAPGSVALRSADPRQDSGTQVRSEGVEGPGARALARGPAPPGAPTRCHCRAPHSAPSVEPRDRRRSLKEQNRNCYRTCEWASTRRKTENVRSAPASQGASTNWLEYSDTPHRTFDREKSPSAIRALCVASPEAGTTASYTGRFRSAISATGPDHEASGSSWP